MTTALGTIETEGSNAAILFERRLPHPIDVVWQAITQPGELAAWFGHVAIEGRQGGTIVVEAGPEEIPLQHRRAAGRILIWDPPRSLEYEWKQPIVEESTVRFDLAPDGETTILKLTHRWMSPRNASGFIPGWHAYLDRLAAHLDGTEIPDWKQQYGRVQPSYGGSWSPPGEEGPQAS